MRARHKIPFDRPRHQPVGVRGPRAWAPILLVLLLGLGCGGPRTQILSEDRFEPLGSNARVEVYLGEVDLPHQPIALIDSEAYPFVDDEVKLRQIEELQGKARRLGANVIQDVRILPKVVDGFSVDERVPFRAYKQGRYELYFMRAMAIRMPDVEPDSLDELIPEGGWVVERHAPPPRLEVAIQQIPLPPLRVTVESDDVGAADNAPAE